MRCVSQLETIDLIRKYKTTYKSFNISGLNKNNFPPELFSTFCNHAYSP